VATLRVAFAGSPDFAARILAPLAARHTVVVAYCQPARPAGRGRRPQPCAVERLAAALGIPIETPRTLRTAEAPATLAAFAPDVMVVAAYGLILPPGILALPRLGCINVHASLLPRWRGAAPIERALMAGDTATGISIMKMDAGLDTGPVLARTECPIGATDTGASLTERLADLGAQALLECLDDPLSWHPQAQPEWGITYAHKLAPSESLVDWSVDASALSRHIRALDARHPAFSFLGTERVRFLLAHPVAGHAPPGEILAFDRAALTIACGQGAVAVTRLQLPRGKGLPLDAAAAYNGYRTLLAPGRRFAGPERHAAQPAS
jgi:methionyl-tRNA formyltransferase